MTKREIPAGLLGDPGWRGALHIVNAPLFADKGVWSFVDLEKRTFNYRLMLKKCRVFSTGEYQLLEVAASLFNEEVKVNLWNLVNGLDSNNLRLVLEAITLSRGDTTAEDAMRERMEAFSHEILKRDPSC